MGYSQAGSDLDFTSCSYTPSVYEYTTIFSPSLWALVFSIIGQVSGIPLCSRFGRFSFSELPQMLLEKKKSHTTPSLHQPKVLRLCTSNRIGIFSFFRALLWPHLHHNCPGMLLK